MALIFDIHSAKLYESWYNSPMGRSMDAFIERIVPEILKPQQYERVLDIGCGTGNHLLFLNKLGLSISGIDASPYMIHKSRERLGNRCTLKIGMAEDLPFDDNEFDLTVLINTLEFLDDPKKALREAGRVTKSKVFIGVMNSLSWYCLMDKLKDLFRESISKHIRRYNLWELMSYIRLSYGSVPIDWRGEPGWPRFMDRTGGFLSDIMKWSTWPFGSFLGIAATIEYRVKTNNLPLRVRVPKTEQSVISGIPTIGNTKNKIGALSNERGLFI